MRNQQNLVREFHAKFDQVQNYTPTMRVTPELLALRSELIREESAEFAEAADAQDLIGMVDALGDILYVTLGAANVLGVDIEKVFDEVHRSNMSKVWSDGTVRKRADGKVAKPPTYSPADIKKVLIEQGAQI